MSTEKETQDAYIYQADGKNTPKKVVDGSTVF